MLTGPNGVRRWLAAGGSRTRTFRPSPDQPLAELGADELALVPGLALRRRGHRLHLKHSWSASYRCSSARRISTHGGAVRILLKSCIQCPVSSDDPTPRFRN